MFYQEIDVFDANFSLSLNEAINVLLKSIIGSEFLLRKKNFYIILGNYFSRRF